MSQLSKNIFITVLVIVIMSVGFYFIQLPNNQIDKIDLQTFVEQVNEGQVKQAEVDGSSVSVTLNDVEETKQTFEKEPQESLSEMLVNLGVPAEKILAFEISVAESSEGSIFMTTVLPILLPILLLGLLFFFFIRQLQGANNKAMMFGQSGARQSDPAKKNPVTFKDVAGAAVAKEELMEIVEFLKSPKKFLALGAKIPKGVLLMGSPGTGKTLLARAVAGQAGVPFFSISGSEFVEMFVGVGASRVRDLFKKAKKNSPCIVFIDEIDAVGRQRGSGVGGSHDEREQTLNQILVEMDGFDNETNVIVVAATNRPDVLDPALLRPGRFDRQIVIDKPDMKERQQILEVHAKNKPFEKDLDLKQIAQRTPGFAGAELANILNEAAILTARQDRKKINHETVLESIEKVSIGPQRKSHVLSDEEKRLTAFHEGGHAIVAHMLEHADPVHKVSVISRGRAAGYTMTIPEDDKKMQKRSAFRDELAVMLGGHSAELEVNGEVTTGPHNDLMRATQLARRMVTEFAMTDAFPPRTFGERQDMIFLGKDIHENRDYSEKVAEQIDEEVNKLMAEAQERSLKVIRDNRKKLNEIVDVLMEKETIEKKEWDEIMKK